MPKRQNHRCLWWQYPSLSDAPVGPWSLDLPRADDDPWHHWQRAIDWMADLGINVFVGSAESYLKGATHSQCPDWPFSAVCEWPEFPGARIASTWRLQHRRRQFNRIIDRFHERGIRVYLHHYNFFAPYQWLIRQPSMAAKRLLYGDVKELPPYAPEALARSVCANDPAYRAFMQATWRELFERLPQLDGLLISMGESNRCQCPECCGRQAGEPEGAYESSPQRLATFARFAELYVQTLAQLNKDPMIRAWHGGGDEEIARAMPRGPVYLIKYSGFNSIDCDPDPLYRYWRDAGHRLWVVHEVAGNENAGPCTWLNPSWVEAVNRRAVEQMPIDGSVAFHNNFMARLDQVYPPLFFNMEVAARLFDGQAHDPPFWTARAEALMGPLAGTYLKAGQLYSQVVLNIDKVVSSPTDGICFCFHNQLLGRGWPGVVGEKGADGTEPHPWLRGDIAPLRCYRNYLEDHPWHDDIARLAVPSGKVDPLGYLKMLWDKAGQGCAMLDESADVEPAFASSHWIICLSARWAEQFGRFWYHLLRAKVRWWGANGLLSKLPVQRQLATDCLADIDEAIEAVRELQSIYDEFPAQYIHWGRAAQSCGLAHKLALYRRTRADVERHFAPLLNGKVFKWPSVEHHEWPEA